MTCQSLWILILDGPHYVQVPVLRFLNGPWFPLWTYYLTCHLGLCKKLFSHNSPSERIVPTQEAVHLLGFLDSDDAFLTRVWDVDPFLRWSSSDRFYRLVSALVSSNGSRTGVYESSLHILSALSPTGIWLGGVIFCQEVNKCWTTVSRLTSLYKLASGSLFWLLLPPCFPVFLALSALAAFVWPSPSSLILCPLCNHDL